MSKDTKKYDKRYLAGQVEPSYSMGPMCARTSAAISSGTACQRVGTSRVRHTPALVHTCSIEKGNRFVVTHEHESLLDILDFEADLRCEVKWIHRITRQVVSACGGSKAVGLAVFLCPDCNERFGRLACESCVKALMSMNLLIEVRV